MLKKLSFTAPIILITATLISACEEPLPPVVTDSRPVKTVVVNEGLTGSLRSFPAVVDAIQKADISFRVRGRIQKIHVKEGSEVKKGDILAELDPTDFEIKLNDRKASYKTAKANYDRAKELVDKGAISKVEHDNIRAQYFTASANLKEAEQELIYTKLKAQFDGYVAKRHAENFEEVLASQTIFSLEDTSELKLLVDIPENLMINIQRKHENKREQYAIFENIEGKKFPLTFLEATTKADVNTKTFKVTLKLQNPEDYTVLPGMTATVYARLFTDELGGGSVMTLPISAVIADTNKKATVWIVDEGTMTAKPKTVTTGAMSAGHIQVNGLQAGDRVVTAGASFLREGMKVTLLETGEQPE
jgi:RND family efflux transporter MFP subunit